MPAAISAGRGLQPRAHRRVDVAVGVGGQQAPQRPARLGRGRLLALHRIQQVGEDRVLADVVGDVFLGVVGAHLLLVDVLLEDVAQHVGVDLVVVAQWAVVQMPLILVEEVEEALEGRVGDLDGLAVALLDLAHSKRPPLR